MDNAKTVDLSNLRNKLGNSAQSLSAKAKGIYAQHGHWVRATASTGLYVGGSIAFAKATSTAGAVAAGTAMTLGFIGVCGSIVEVGMVAMARTGERLSKEAQDNAAQPQAAAA